MEIATLFVTAVGKADGSKFLPYTRSLYDVVPLARGGKLDTSLDTYLSGQINKNLKIPPSPDFEDFKHFLLGSCISFLDELGYAVNAYDFAVSNIWLNSMKSGEMHDNHCHAGALVSGCFYVDVPDNSPGIVFHSPTTFTPKVSLDVKRHTPASSPAITVTPKEGDLLFWQSNLYHCVPSEQFNGVRRSIAFDVVATNVKPEVLARASEIH